MILTEVIKIPRRKWKYDKNVFKTIDTVDKAYWLGFIMADGYVFDNLRKNNKSDSTGLRIRLAESDGSHLNGLNELFSYNKPLIKVKNYGIYENAQDLIEFLISSREIALDLEELGVQINGGKSCNEKFIEFEDINLTKNFILGVFDGDGAISNYQSWSKRDNKYKSLSEMSLFSSLEMITSVEEFLIDNLDIKFQKISKDHRSENLYRSRTSNKKYIKKLYDFFYNSNCTQYYMRRKQIKMKESFTLKIT